MNIETRLKALENANRRYRLLISVVLCSLLVVAFAAARDWPSGDSLQTPVHFLAPSGTMVLRVNDVGELEFMCANRTAMKLNRSTVAEYKDALEDHAETLHEQAAELEKHRTMLKEHAAQLQNLERHVRRDRVVR